MPLQIDIPQEELAAFCRRHRIRRLALFGSVLREDFGPESDVDVLVEFEPETRVGLITLAGIELKLSQLLGRRAELHLSEELHPRFRGDVLKAARVQYESA